MQIDKQRQSKHFDKKPSNKIKGAEENTKVVVLKRISLRDEIIPFGPSWILIQIQVYSLLRENDCRFHNLITERINERGMRDRQDGTEREEQDVALVLS